MTADLSGLNYTLSELAAVLGVDGRQLVKTEAGQYAGQIADQLGPKNLSSATKKAERELKGIVSFKPVRENIKGAHQGTGDVRWLYAGSKFLAGIAADDNKVMLQAAAVRSVIAAEKKKGYRGKAWLDQGNRGNQNVVILNRVRVSKAAYQEVFKGIKEKFGSLRATFAYTSAKLIGKRVPAFVSRHFGDSVRGKAIFDDSALNHPTNPSITFGSRAAGVISNAKISGIIEGAAKYRAKLMAEKITKILSGYAYDLKTGGTFKPRAGKEYGSNVILPS